MRFAISCAGVLAVATACLPGEAFGRGFGVARGGVAVGARGGVAAGGAYRGVAAGPFGGVHAGVARGGTYVGPHGTTVQAGRVAGTGYGPLGGFHAGAAQGVRVTTPGGQTFTRGSAGGVGVGPFGGVHAAGVAGTAVRGPYGAAAVGRAGGIATGPYGGFAAAGYRGGIATRPYGGFAAAGYRGGVAVGPYGGVAVGRAGGIAVGHATGYLSPVAMRTRGAFVRSGFRSTCFTPGWYGLHPAAWVAPRWRVPNFWVAPTWTTLAGWCGVAAAPLLYDYGSSVVINDNQVYMDGAPIASAEQYADQAAAFADRGREAPPAADAEWQSLGVFGMIQPDDKVANQIFQLAVNPNGVIRGNYYDAVADNTLPVYGSVDRATQRAAWSIGDKKNVVFEAGLNNLTQEQSTLLVHYGKDRTQQMVLVRLEQPNDRTP